MVRVYHPSAPGPIPAEVYRELQRISETLGEIRRELDDLAARVADLEAVTP